MRKYANARDDKRAKQPDHHNLQMGGAISAVNRVVHCCLRGPFRPAVDKTISA